MNRLFKSFGYALMGIGNSVLLGKNLRIQLITGLIVLTIMPFFAQSKTEYAIIILTVIIIPTMELVNTAIEYVVDLITLERKLNAGAAKDAIAGAVLFCCIGAIGVGLIFFTNKNGWNELIDYARDYIWYGGLLILELILFITIVITNTKKKGNNK